MNMSEIMAIKHFCAWKSLTDPHFEEIDNLMCDYWKKLPLDECFPVYMTLNRIVRTFKHEEEADLHDGDSLILERYYYKCRRAHFRNKEKLRRSA